MKGPLLLVGGVESALETGRALDFTKSGDEDRGLYSLYLSIIDRMGVELDHFGDAKTRLARL